MMNQYFSAEKDLETDCFNPAFSETQIDHEITRMFIMLGIPLRIQGFHFAKDCIKLAFFNKVCIFKVNTLIFEPVANKYSTSKTNVERAIRHALSVVCKQNKMCELAKLLGVKESFELLHPSVAEFIALVTECLHFSRK